MSTSRHTGPTTSAGGPWPGLARVEVESAEADDLLHDTITTARDSVAVLAAGAIQVADTFRGLNINEAHTCFGELAEGVRQLTLLTAALATAAVVDLSSLWCGPPGAFSSHGPETASQIIDGVGVGLQRLLVWQAAHDWVGAADCLEFDLAPALDRWSTVFDADASRKSTERRAGIHNESDHVARPVRRRRRDPRALDRREADLSLRTGSPPHHRARQPTDRLRFGFGGRGSGPGQFDTPLDVVFVAPEFQGEGLPDDAPEAAWLAVADYGNRRVQIFDLDGCFVGAVADSDETPNPARRAG